MKRKYKPVPNAPKGAAFLRKTRIEKGFLSKDLAKESGIAISSITCFENGSIFIGEERAKKLASVLDVDYKLLLEK